MIVRSDMRLLDVVGGGGDQCTGLPAIILCLAPFRNKLKQILFRDGYALGEPTPRPPAGKSCRGCFARARTACCTICVPILPGLSHSRRGARAAQVTRADSPKTQYGAIYSRIASAT